jgi:hypothetical protein
MPFDSPPPPDPYNRPWMDVLHLRAPDPEHCYFSESRWSKKRATAKRKNKRKQSPPDSNKN